MQKRRRGVILTPQGLQKLQVAKADAEISQNAGQRYTLEALSERTGLSVDTMMKVLKRETGVDKQTLKCCFSAFDLILEPNDFCLPNSYEFEALPELNSAILETEPELPGGQVPLHSRFYVERSPAEAECLKAIVQPGALIRIKAPRRMGKTSLIAKVLDHTAKLGFYTVPLNFQLADKVIFQDLDKFLRWFCASVGLGMQLPNQLDHYWDDLFGSKVSCKIYFEQYLLTKIQTPVLLGLDDIDQLFQYPDIADEFFGLLRAWHEEAKNREIWKRLRLIMSHSTEVYIPLNVNKSPFNVGLPVELPAFNGEQIQFLAEKHNLDWSLQQTEQLRSLVGGQPYLIRVALYHLWRGDITLTDLSETAPAALNLYSDHLRGLLWVLQQSPELMVALGQVVTTSVPVELDLVQAFKLQSLGLVELQGKFAQPSCRLYQQYFQACLNA
jgi:hypothetical protein